MSDQRENPATVSLVTIVREWGRIGCIGFGGPPTHIKLLRELCVERRHWMDAQEFEDAIAVCNLLPGPASTQLAIFCAWRLRGRIGAGVGGAAFIIPGLIVILALAALFLGTSPPPWVLGAGAGAGAAVPAVAIQAGAGLTGASWQRRGHTARWLLYLLAGIAAAATLGPWLVVVLLGCGLIELTFAHRQAPRSHRAAGHSDGPGACGRRARRRGAAVGGLGRVQSRGTVLRRRVRHHPAHAIRRGQPLPLDDRRAVPQRRRPGPDHPRPGGPDRRRRRLRGGRPDRRRSRLGRRVQPRRSRSSCSAPPGSTRSAATATRGPSSTAPGPPPSAPSSAPPSRSPGRSPMTGSTPSWPPR